MNKKGGLLYAIYRMTKTYRHNLHKRIDENFEAVLKLAKEKQQSITKN